MKQVASALRTSATLLLVLTVLLGGVYPLLVTAVAQVLFHDRANGSLVERNGVALGSALLGQNFTSPKYFWGRLSATQPPYNAAASTASNLSPANPKLLQGANERLEALQKADAANKARIPVDLITASASGLDPHISVAAAEYQVGRVAKARHMKKEDVAALVRQYTEKPCFGLLGEPYINVLRLNMALDESGK